MNQNNATGWAVLVGVGLIGLGVWLLLGGPFSPVAWLISILWHVGWPLVLVGLGVLLIIRARGGGFNVNGKKLYRSRTNRMVGGVIGGLADYLGIDATVLRIVYALLTIFTGFFWGIVLYVLAMIIVPDEYQPVGWTPYGAPAGYGSPPAAPPVPQAPSAPTPPPAPAPPAYTSPSTPPAAPPVPQSVVVPPPPSATPPAAPAVPEPVAAGAAPEPEPVALAPEAADTNPPQTSAGPSEPTIL